MTSGESKPHSLGTKLWALWVFLKIIQDIEGVQLNRKSWIRLRYSRYRSICSEDYLPMVLNFTTCMSTYCLRMEKYNIFKHFVNTRLVEEWANQYTPLSGGNHFKENSRSSFKQRLSKFPFETQNWIEPAIVFLMLSNLYILYVWVFSNSVFYTFRHEFTSRDRVQACSPGSAAGTADPRDHSATTIRHSRWQQQPSATPVQYQSW